MQTTVALRKRSNPELYNVLSKKDKEKIDFLINDLDRDTIRSASLFTVATEAM